MKETFRSNNDRTLFIAPVKAVPLSLGLGGQYYLTDVSSVYFELKRFGNQLSTSDKVTLTVMPAIVGYRYYFFEDDYRRASIGGGVGLYWARVSVTYIRFDLNGFHGGVADSKNYFGFGANVGLAYECLLSKRTSLGIVLNST
jgi:hypothetical protein